MSERYLIDPEVAATDLRPGGRLTLVGGRHLQRRLVDVRSVSPSDCLMRLSWVFGLDMETGAAVAECIEVRRCDAWE